MLTKVPLHDAEGEVVGLCGVATDVSELKKMEQALRLEDFEFEQAQTCLSQVQSQAF